MMCEIERMNSLYELMLNFISNMI